MDVIDLASYKVLFWGHGAVGRAEEQCLKWLNDNGYKRIQGGPDVWYIPNKKGS